MQKVEKSQNINPRVLFHLAQAGVDKVVVKVHKQWVLNGVYQACEGMKVRSARITARADRQRLLPKWNKSAISGEF